MRHNQGVGDFSSAFAAIMTTIDEQDYQYEYAVLDQNQFGLLANYEVADAPSEILVGVQTSQSMLSELFVEPEEYIRQVSPETAATDNPSKVNDVVTAIDNLNKNGWLVHFVGARGVRENCVVTSFNETASVEWLRGAKININLEQLIVIDNPASQATEATQQTDAENVSSMQSNTTTEDSNPATRSRTMRSSNYGAYAATDVTVDTGLVSTSFELEEFESEDHESVPFSTTYDTIFNYNGIQYTLSKLWTNERTGQLMTNLKWRNAGVQYGAYSIALTSGVDIVHQYDTGLPSLVALNNEVIGEDPTDASHLELYLIQNFDKYFIGE